MSKHMNAIEAMRVAATQATTEVSSTPAASPAQKEHSSISDALSQETRSVDQLKQIAQLKYALIATLGPLTIGTSDPKLAAERWMRTESAIDALIAALSPKEKEST